jgi:hypothetical protein
MSLLADEGRGVGAKGVGSKGRTAADTTIAEEEDKRATIEGAGGKGRRLNVVEKTGWKS